MHDSASAPGSAWLAQQLYFPRVADARPHHVQVDEDADDLSFPAMVSQLFEFVLCILSNSTFLPLLQPVFPELVYLTIGDTMHPLLHAHLLRPDRKHQRCSNRSLACQAALPAVTRVRDASH